MTNVIYEDEFIFTDIHEFKGNLKIEEGFENDKPLYLLTMHNGIQKSFNLIAEILVMIKSEIKRLKTSNNLTHKAVSEWMGKMYKDIHKIK